MQHESGQDGVCRLTWTACASRKHMLSRAGGQRETGAPPEMSDQEGAERGFHSLARYDQGDDSQP